MKANSLQAGRIYSVIFNSTVETVQTRDGMVNPMIGQNVTVRRVFSVQAAGPKTYENFLAKRGLTPAHTVAPWFRMSDFNPCIVEGITQNTLGRKYLRGIPKGKTKEDYFVNGHPASTDEIANIQFFRRSKSAPEFVTLSTEKLENLEMA